MGDIYVIVKGQHHLISFRENLEHESGLTFTYELGIDVTLPILEVNVQTEIGRYKTTKFGKPTDLGKCMNALHTQRYPLVCSQSV